jgi:hypothetical protein
MMKKTKCIAGALVLSMGLMFAPGDGRASDRKWFPGLYCVKDSPSDGQTMINWFGTVANPSSTTGLHIQCPLVRDGIRIDRASIHVFDRSPAADSGFVSCTLSFMAASGATVVYGGSLENGTGVSRANFQSIPYGPISGGDYYFASCFLPRSGPLGLSHIVRFEIEES